MQFTTPEQSRDALEGLLADAEAVLQLLELPYRVVSLCTGDLGFLGHQNLRHRGVGPPGQNTYREISSCSNFLDFQHAGPASATGPGARKRAAWSHPERLRPGGGPTRWLVAILENHQQADGTVRLPAALQPYFTDRF